MSNDSDAFGLDLTIDECDRLQMQFIKAKYADVDLNLFGSKWFDYRFYHPVQATYVFAHHYVRAYRAVYAAVYDKRAAENVKPLKHEDVFKCHQTVITGVWRARQHADAIGIPYDLFLRLAFEAMLKYWRDQKHLPRPQQLYCDRAVDFVTEQWEKRQEARLYIASHEEYRIHNYIGSPMQNDHHEWLFSQAALRGNRPDILARLIFDDEVLPLEKAIGRLPADLIENVKQAA